MHSPRARAISLFGLAAAPALCRGDDDHVVIESPEDSSAGL